MPKPRKKPGTQSYILHGIPLELWEAAKAKAAAQEPAPFTMRWAMLTALTEWVRSAPGSDPKVAADEKPSLF